MEDKTSSVDADDEIEILEVIGLDEDTPGAQPCADVDDEIVLDLDEDDEDPVATAAIDDETDERCRPDEISETRILDDKERLSRLAADFEAYKRRHDRERDNAQAQAAAALIQRILPVLDNFERAMALGPQPDNEAAMRDGIVLIFRQILDELRKEGLEALEVVGETFDPNLHEAVETDAGSGLPPNTVVEEMQRGYRLGGRLLRPALVRVSVDPASSGDGDQGA